MLKAAALAPLAFIPLSQADAMRAAEHAFDALRQQAGGTPYVPKWFSADEWKELRIVVDMIIPKDRVSGSATDAGVPEFMDWTCKEYTPSYNSTRDALRWVDGFAYSTYHKNFVHCTDAERRALFDQVAWPAKASKELAEGVAHFNRLRDFTASGFFSSKMGVADLKYLGNVARPSWDGCPKPALDHLGVSYT
jgi:hypothetical protein